MFFNRGGKNSPEWLAGILIAGDRMRDGQKMDIILSCDGVLYESDAQ